MTGFAKPVLAGLILKAAVATYGKRRAARPPK
jgi:hypothetical protein